MMGCHFQDRSCRASLCLRGLYHDGPGTTHYHICDADVARRCPHRAWEHSTHLEVCGRRASVADCCPHCGGRHRYMGDVLRCELSRSIERAFADGRQEPPSRISGPIGEHLPEGMRASAWHAIRERVLERDGRRCRACGKDLSSVPSWLAEVHHLVPRIEGGSDHPSNLVTLCVMCHKRITAEHGINRMDASARDEHLPRECLEVFR